MEGNLRFKIHWASLIVGRKFNVFALFYFVFEGNLRVQAPRGAYIWRGDLTEGFFTLRFWGAYIFRRGFYHAFMGLFSEFYGSFSSQALLAIPSLACTQTLTLFYFSFRSFRTHCQARSAVSNRNPPRFLFFITRARQT